MCVGEEQRRGDGWKWRMREEKKGELEEGSIVVVILKDDCGRWESVC